MAHECPVCYQACYCGGDIDDCEMELPPHEECTHCEGKDIDDVDDDCPVCNGKGWFAKQVGEGTGSEQEQCKNCQGMGHI